MITGNAAEAEMDRILDYEETRSEQWRQHQLKCELAWQLTQGPLWAQVRLILGFALWLSA